MGTNMPSASTSVALRMYASRPDGLPWVEPSGRMLLSKHPRHIYHLRSSRTHEPGEHLRFPVLFLTSTYVT